MADRNYPESIVSPFGTAEWAALVEPDTKFNPLGDFKVNLRLSEEEAEGLIKKITSVKEAALVKFREEAKAEGKTPKAIEKIKLSDIDPFVEDDEVEGEFIFKFKRKAAIVKDNGEKLTFDIGHVDATGKSIPADRLPNIGNGSIIRVMAELVPYHMPTSGVGVSLRLKKVQIKKLVEFSPDGPSFDAIEDGGYVPEGMDSSFGDVGDAEGYSV